MVKVTTIYRPILLVLLQLFFLICIEGKYLSYYNTTDEEFTIQSDRSKRSLFDKLPQILHAMIIDETGNYIYLKWEKTNRYVANDYLPVWTASEYRDKLDKKQKNQLNIMEQVGEFVTYHDLEKTSTVVYFEESRSLHGVIDTQYYIDDLPIESLYKCHKVGGEYVNKHKKLPHTQLNYPIPPPEIMKLFIDCESPADLKKNSLPSIHERCSIENLNTEQVNSKQYYEKFAGRHPNNGVSENYYVETLALVTYDITETFKDVFDDSYLLQIVIDYIVYFHAIDMIFAKLNKHNVNIYINIAGIIIEDKKNIFYELFSNPALSYDEKSNILVPHNIDWDIKRHFNDHRSIFPSDSIDLFFLTTNRKMWYDNLVDGLTYHGEDMYNNRYKNKPYDGIPTTILRYKYNYENYMTAAHEIGHSLEVDHDLSNSGMFKNGHQCSSVMQFQNSYCLNCMDWSKESIDQLIHYTSNNVNRCFLLNYPRALNGDKPTKSLSPCRQCHCYRFETYASVDNMCLQSIPTNACKHRLPCVAPKSTSPKFVSTILPLDGTPCGNNMVCWHGKCVEVA